MKLSEIVKEYRRSHRLSLRTFADRCGLAHTVIDHVEKEVNQLGTSLIRLQKSQRKKSKANKPDHKSNPPNRIGGFSA